MRKLAILLMATTVSGQQALAAGYQMHIAKPISARRANPFSIACRTGEDGCSRITPNVHAETMKIPSSDASIA